MTVNFHSEKLAGQLLKENPVLARKVAAALECREQDAATALQEVLRFLCLVANHPSGMLTPSHRVDLAWHEFILCTRAYDAFCERWFGRFIHHYPGGSDEQNRRQFSETLRCYEQQFGPPEPSFWGRSDEFMGSCGACEAS